MESLRLLILDNCVSVTMSVVFVALLAYMWSRRSHQNLQPGPTPLPLIGTIYAHGFRINPATLASLSKRYGNVFCIYMGSKRLVILNTYDVIREAKMRPWEFSHRGLNDKRTWMLIHTSGLHGLFAKDYGHALIKERNVTINILRQLGMGKAIIEDKIIQEIGTLCEMYSNLNNNQVNPHTSIHISVANVIIHILLNQRFTHGEESVNFLLQNTSDFINSIMAITLIDSIPLLHFVPPFNAIVSKMVTASAEIRKFMHTNSQHIFDDFEVGNTPCFVQSYIEDFYEHEKNLKDVDRTALDVLLHDLLVGGFETSSTVLEWVIVLLSNRPHVQQRVFKEIENAVGLHRPVRMCDKDQLPYLESVIWEAQRYRNIAPVLVHESTQDKTSDLCNYTIPKGTALMLNIQAVHMNENTWTDPEVFRPERFLNSEGKFTKHAELIPFSVGKRSCPGELLAKQELFLFAANLFQRFNFSPPDGVERIDETAVESFIYHPKPFDVKILPRV